MTNKSLHDLNSQLRHASPIGFMGIGNMGFAMMSRLRDQGWSCACYDINPHQIEKAQKAGAAVLGDASQLGSACRVSFLVVVDAAQVHDVLWGPAGFMSTALHGDVIYLCPTLGPLDVADITKRAQSQGVIVIDAPMSGGPVRAREGQMSLMLAGAAPVLQQHAPLLDAITPHRFVISETPGDAGQQRSKLDWHGPNDTCAAKRLCA